MTRRGSNLVRDSASVAARLWGVAAVFVLVLVPVAAAQTAGLLSEQAALGAAVVLSVPVLLGAMVAAARLQRRRAVADRQAALRYRDDLDAFFARLGVAAGERSVLLNEVFASWSPGAAPPRPTALDARLIAFAAQKARDRWLRRAAGPAEPLGGDDAAAAASAPPVSEPDLAALQLALDAMPPVTRACLQLRYRLPLSEAQVATVLRLREAEAASLLAEARRLVPRALRPAGL